MEDHELGNACMRTEGCISGGLSVAESKQREGRDYGPAVPDPRMRAACESFPPAIGGDMFDYLPGPPRKR